MRSTVSGVVSGTGSLTQAGSGTTILTGANTYTGGTTIASGTLQIGDGGTTGQLGPGPLVNNGVLAINRSDTVTFDSVLSGTGALAQIGTGTTILTAANTYEGGTTIAAGTLQVGTGGTSGQLGAGGIVNDGVLAINRSDEVTLSNDISGTGTLAQIGAGTTILTGSNTSSGPTIIASGVLQVGNGGTTGELGTGDVLNQTALVFNRSGSLTVPGAISGAGTVTQVGTGTTIFTGANTYSGATTISAGTLQIGDGGTSGQLGTGAVVNNGSLVFNRSDAIAVSNPISGTGSLTQAGIGVLTLSGAKTYTGNTFVNEGTLLLDGSLAGSTIVAPAALLGGAGLIGGTLTVNGTVMVGPLDTTGSLNGGSQAFAPRRHAGLSQTFRAIAASAQASLGTLSVAGDVTFTAGARNVVTLDATGGHTLLTTDGTAAIGGATIVVAPQPGSYGRVTTYPVLYATGGLTGRATAATTNADLWPWANSTPDTLLVTVLNPAVPLQPLATTTNGAAFGAASDRLRPGATGDFLVVSRELTALDDVSLTGALDALAGEIHSSSLQLAALDGEAATDMVRRGTGHTRHPRDGAPRVAEVDVARRPSVDASPDRAHGIRRRRDARWRVESVWTGGRHGLVAGSTGGSLAPVAVTRGEASHSMDSTNRATTRRRAGSAMRDIRATDGPHMAG